MLNEGRHRACPPSVPPEPPGMQWAVSELEDSWRKKYNQEEMTFLREGLCVKAPAGSIAESWFESISASTVL